MRGGAKSVDRALLRHSSASTALRLNRRQVDSSMESMESQLRYKSDKSIKLIVPNTVLDFIGFVKASLHLSLEGASCPKYGCRVHPYISMASSPQASTMHAALPAMVLGHPLSRAFAFVDWFVFYSYLIVLFCAAPNTSLGLLSKQACGPLHVCSCALSCTSLRS